MPTHSLHLGLNRTDPAHYPGLPPLRAAVNDAHDWASLARGVLGYSGQEILTDEQATATALLHRLESLAKVMNDGDALLLTYSGHGGQIADELSPLAGDENKDQTWCLYDRQLIDDELYLAFSRFRAGVHIMVVADCCHSGTSTRDIPEMLSSGQYAQLLEQQAIENDLEMAGFTPRRLSQEQSAKVFAEHYDQYTALRQSLPNKRPAVSAIVQLFAACQDDQIAFDGPVNGIFTEAFKTLLLSGEWRQITSAEALMERLLTFFRYPRPNYLVYGGASTAGGEFPLAAERQSPAATTAPAPVQKIAGSPPPFTGTAPTNPAVPRPDSFKIVVEMPDSEATTERIAALCPSAGIRQITITADRHRATIVLSATLFPSAWDAAHYIAAQADAQNIDLYVEPAQTAAFPLIDDAVGAQSRDGGFEYLPFWPPVTQQLDPPLGWHLDDEHSQLASARDFVWQKLRNGELRKNIRIGQLDTGWYPWHPAFAFNPNIQRNRTRSFVDAEKGINQTAIDLRYKAGEQHGHGSGTLGVLAGWTIDPKLVKGLDLGYVGAIPFAEIVPIRIADSVMIFDTENFCEGLEYAIEIGCSVITMSMGGKPSRRMARMINRAYENGVVIVTAAGNNFTKGLSAIGPKTVVWPARFQRVLAACGACFNHVPYDFEAQARYGAPIKGSDFRYMQGNWGPGPAMHKALAAYSPNVPWLGNPNQQLPVSKSGGGTSVATPQIASAAALWLTLHRDELERRGYAGTWKQVEAVREALFHTADKSFPEWKKYYGNGILRAMDALKFGVPHVPDSLKVEEADSSLAGLGELVGLFLKRSRAAEAPGPVLRRSLEMELQQLAAINNEQAEANPGTANIEEMVYALIRRSEHSAAINQHLYIK